MSKFFLFLFFPALELYLLIKGGSVFGAWHVVLWVFATIALGIWVVRIQGRESLNKVRAELEAGHVPKDPFIDGLLFFLAGILLILPGFLTDTAGFLLLLPPVRRQVSVCIGRYIAARGRALRMFFFTTGGGFGGSCSQMGPEPDASFAQQAGPRQATIIKSVTVDVTHKENGRANKDDLPPPYQRG